MTGPEHYKEAERLVAQAELWRDFDCSGLTAQERIGWTAADAALAQVHATLALADAEDREAAAEARIAECVPEGGSRLNVAVAGAR